MNKSKRQIDYDEISDFGFAQSDIKYINLESDGVSNQPNHNTVYSNNDLSTGKFFTMDEILSGGTLVVSQQDAVNKTQAELSLDNSLATNLAYFGSVYSVVQIAISNIKGNYPNGFLVVDAITGVNAFMFNASDTYMYGGAPFKIIDYSDYELVQTYNDAYDKTFQILEQITGTTFSLFLEVDGQPSLGVAYDHIIQPKQETLDKFYSTVSQYGLDLLVPPFDRINFWPRDLVAPNNILMDGTRYDDFLEIELTFATIADDEDTNFMWRKLYPDGQKYLDSDDGLMQKLVLTMAMNFDNIKRYQDQLKYQHTIGYNMSNHISKDLVGLIANQWNWNIGHTLNHDDYSMYVYSTYDNYVTGQSQQKMSARDINFEMMRRVLSNIPTLYKKKGTIEAIKYIANIYGLPEELLYIEELVKVGDKNEIVESEGNIVVPMSGSMYYVDENGSARTISHRTVTNTKYLNINISPFDAIEFDFYDWGWDHHPNITNINGLSTKMSGTAEITRGDFFKNVYKNTIKSDGSSKYASRYPILENEGNIYYTSSPNKLKMSILDPYVDFLDDSWNMMMSNIIPASSKLLSSGNLYRNPMWRREKYQWNISELTPKPLPFNETITIPYIIPTITTNPRVVVKLDPISVVSEIPKSVSATLDEIILTSTIAKNNSCDIQINDPVGEYIERIEDTHTVGYAYTSQTYTIGSPIIEPISGQYGTLDYVNYNVDSLVVSNQNTFDIIFSAYNLSDSGYTKINIELFKRDYDGSVVVDDGVVYSITSIDYENEQYGSYAISNLSNIELFDYISISSDHFQLINNIVQIVYIDAGTSRIRTSPSIGLTKISNGLDNGAVDWIKFSQSSSMPNMKAIYRLGVSIPDITTILTRIVRGNVTNPYDGIQIAQSTKRMFEWFASQNASILNTSLIVLEFLNGNNSYTFNTNISSLVNAIISHQTTPTFKRVVNFFDWSNPTQTIQYSNYGIGDGNFNLPIIDITARTLNTFFSTTGSTTIGGLDSLNSEILKDKYEYFYRYKVETHAPKEWETINGQTILSGGTLLDSEYDLKSINNIKYYGRYFTFIKTPKTPISTLLNFTTSAMTTVDPIVNLNITNDSSVSVRFNGVGDSNRLELQYLPVYSSDTPFDSYTAITESAWTVSSGITINIPARKSVGDEYLYTVQTTLSPDTYYWWRLKNFRNKLSMFGHNQECYTSTKPEVFMTGSFAGGGRNAGEIGQIASSPSLNVKDKGNTLNQQG